MQTKRSMTLTGSRRTNVLILSAILVVVAIAVGLLVLQRSATPLPAQLSGNTSVARPALDQHERHATGFPSSIDTPLDQHERHSELLDASGEAETGVRDQWWADQTEDDPNANRDAWWLDK